MEDKERLKYCKFYKGGTRPISGDYPRTILAVTTDDAPVRFKYKSDGSRRTISIRYLATAEYFGVNRAPNMTLWKNCGCPGEESELPNEFIASMLTGLMHHVEDPEQTLEAFRCMVIPTLLAASRG